MGIWGESEPKQESGLIGMAENKSIEVTLVSSRVISEKGRKEYGVNSRGLT